MEKINWCLLGCFISLLSSCNGDLLQPKGQIALEQLKLISIAFYLMLIVIIPVIVMAVLFTWQYRSYKAKKYSPEWSNSAKIEAVVWIVPILIVLILSILSWVTTHKLDPKNQIANNINKPIEIEAIALDWNWLFIYPKFNIAAINLLYLPVNTSLVFNITSNSVMNSFFIPSLGSQVYAMAGMKTKLNLIANETGICKGISSNFSGYGFSGMKFKVIITNNSDFKKWITSIKNHNNTILSVEKFEKVAVPSNNHQVRYFYKVKPDLFDYVIHKFK